jgi:hypothetical protein
MLKKFSKRHSIKHQQEYSVGGTMQIYLGGGIKGMDFTDANAWRLKATAILESTGHTVVNPLRGRVWNSKDEQTQFSMNEIIHRDLFDVDRCDCLLVEMTDPNRHYTGTTVEMTRARMTDKMVVVFVGKDVCPFGWLEGYLATKVVETLEEAIDYINGVLV